MESSDRIRIGVICGCKDNEEFGWLYSYLCFSYNYGRKIHSSQMFFTFRKEKSRVIEDGTLVAFISLNDAKGYAVNVIELKELPFFYADSEDKEKIKQAIQDKRPYWEIHYPWRFDYCCINFPYKHNKYQETDIVYKVLHGKDEEIFQILYALNCSEFKYLTLEEISDKLLSIDNYVNSFSLENILTTYECGKSGYFQCRPGRDDSFNITYFKKILTEDEYIKSIIPLCEEKDSYACVGRGLDDDDYYIIDQEETEEGRRLARMSYTKNKHKAYLINSFFENYINSKTEYENLLNQLKGLKLSDRFRYDNFGYGNYSMEMLKEKIITINAKALEEYRNLRE